MEEDNVFLFCYSPDIYESCAMTVSVHKTYKGAYSALRSFLLGRHQQWFESPRRMHWLYCIQNDERFFIKKIKLNN